MAAETKIKIRHIPPYDGEYELDFEAPFTAREWRWLKQIGAIYPRNLERALNDADIDLFIALAVICMVRAGKIAREDALDVAERLSDAPFDGSSIELLGGKAEEEEPIPPALTLERNEASSNDSHSSATSPRSPNAISGSDSTSDSAGSVVALSPTGTSPSLT